jgi:hypothetical protein
MAGRWLLFHWTRWIVLAGLGVGAAHGGAQVFVVMGDHAEAARLPFVRTDVELPAKKADDHTRMVLDRAVNAERGYAMRPLPRGSHGLTLEANGGLKPQGSDYVEVLNRYGISANTGDAVTVSNIQFKGERLIVDFDGGPDQKHKYLSHIQIGINGAYAAEPSGPEATGSRVTLVFPHAVPDLSGDELKSLLAPVVRFGAKSPEEAYSQSLPPFLRKAVMDHHVLVGMDPTMVLHALGQPQQRVRERDGRQPFEEWIYGAPPEHVEFVRFEDDRVVRVADADTGEAPKVRSNNEMGDYWASVSPEEQGGHVVRLGDQTAEDREKQNAPTTAPPSLRRPGETLPSDHTHDAGAVQFPKPTQ